MTQHLTDEQLANLLAGELADSATQAHLAACAPCRHEAESVGSAMGSFNEFSLAWAQTEAPRRVPSPSRLSLLLGGRPLWGLGFATAMVAGAIAFIAGAPVKHIQTAPAIQFSAPGSENAELAADNRLMASIDQEIRYEPQPVVPLSQLVAPTRHHQHHLPTSAVR